MNGKKGLIIVIAILVVIIIGLSVALTVVLINQNKDNKETKKDETTTVTTPTPKATPSVKPTSNNNWFDDDDETPSPYISATPYTTASPTNTNSSVAGNYELISMTINGETQSGNDSGVMLKLKIDGTGVLSYGEDLAAYDSKVTWNDKYIISDDNEKMPYTYKNGKLTVNEADGSGVMVFEKK